MWAVPAEWTQRQPAGGGGSAPSLFTLAAPLRRPLPLASARGDPADRLSGDSPCERSRRAVEAPASPACALTARNGVAPGTHLAQWPPATTCLRGASA